MLAALIIAFLIAVSASFICSLCESSFLSLGKTQLAGLMESGNPAGKVLERMKAHPSRPLAAILTVNTIANMMGAAQVGAQASGLWGAGATAAASGILTVAILILGEIIPKTIGTRSATRLAGVTVACVRVMTVITYPVVILLEQVTKILGKDPEQKTTEDDIIAFAKVGLAEGAISQREATAMQRLLRADKTGVDTVMTPWGKVPKVSANLTVAEFVDEVPDIDLNAVAVCEPETDEPVGGLDLRSIYKQIGEKNLTATLREIVKPLHRVDVDCDLVTAFRENDLVLVEREGKLAGMASIFAGAAYVLPGKTSASDQSS